MSASGGVVRDDKQKSDHDAGLEAASVGGLFHCSIFKISLYLASICSSFSKPLSSTSAVICRRLDTSRTQLIIVARTMGSD